MNVTTVFAYTVVFSTVYICTRHESVWESGVLAPFILNLGTRRRWVVSIKLRLLYFRIGSHPYSLNKRLRAPELVWNLWRETIIMSLAWRSDSSQFSAEGRGFVSLKYFCPNTPQNLTRGARFFQIIKIRLLTMRKNILTFPQCEETAIEEDIHQPAT